jgi:hypothetical protein
MITTWTLLQVPLSLVAGFCVLAGIVIRYTFKYRAYQSFVPIDVPSLPDSVRYFFDSSAPKLKEEGFIHITTVYQTGAVNNVRTYCSWWLHPERGQHALCAAVVPNVGQSRCWVEFDTVGVNPLIELETNNLGSAPGVFDSVPWQHKCRLPRETAIGHIYSVHLRREADLISESTPRYIPQATPQDVIEFHTNATVFILRDQARRGLFYETTEAGVFRPTWFGAYMMILRLLPPLKQIRRWKNRRFGIAEAQRAISNPATRPTNVRLATDSPYAMPLHASSLSYT